MTYLAKPTTNNYHMQLSACKERDNRFLQRYYGGVHVQLRHMSA